MKVIREGKNLPIKMWLDDAEDGALEQAKHLAALPFAFKHVALMPDCHQGYGMPIGAVMATKGTIVPSAVGVDIGCGVYAAKLFDDQEVSPDQLKKWMGEIRKVIPMGFNEHESPCEHMIEPETLIAKSRYEAAAKQLRTLGGGNHFIEFQQDERGGIWVMLHSGSRNLGYRVCQYYSKQAKELNKKWHTVVDPKWDLAFLPIAEAQGYLAEMRYCLYYAGYNRQAMMHAILDIVGQTPLWECGIHHNYVAQENHFGQNVWVHRKGATRARAGEFGIIPGSQGTASYIVKGLGNPESFMSCSHGAGRAMSRSQARKTLDLQGEIAKMGNVIHGIRHQEDLDEAAGAYKDIDVVMANQSDLVEVCERLTPLAVMKG